MGNKKPINYKELAILGWVLSGILAIIAIMMGMNWESEIHKFEAQLELAQSKALEPQIIYRETGVEDEDVLEYFQDRIDEFDANSIHIVIDADKFGMSKMTITTESEITNVLYDSILK